MADEELHFDETDVPAALERETHDGPGTDDPESFGEGDYYEVEDNE